jgi:hypothetical protein
MPIRYEHAEPVDATADATFGVIDDLPRMAEWLPPCVRLANTTRPGGPNAVGDGLHYIFQQAGREQEMHGTIVGRVVPESLVMQFDDASFTVRVDLRVTSADRGCVTHHAIEITPKTLFGRLLSPLIRLGLRKQTRDAATGLRRLAETN